MHAGWPEGDSGKGPYMPSCTAIRTFVKGAAALCDVRSRSPSRHLLKGHRIRHHGLAKAEMLLDTGDIGVGERKLVEM